MAFRNKGGAKSKLTIIAFNFFFLFLLYLIFSSLNKTFILLYQVNYFK